MDLFVTIGLLVAASDSTKCIKPASGTRFRNVVAGSEPFVCPPVHAFRLVRERLKHVGTTAQAHSDFLCFPEAAVVQGFVLTRIGQTVAAPACEQFPSTVQQRDTPPAVSTAGIDGTYEPSTLTASVAWRPSDGHSLLNGLPIGVSVASRAIHQEHGVCLSTHFDIAGWLATAGPGPREILSASNAAILARASLADTQLQAFGQGSLLPAVLGCRPRRR
jgi:hypothetical protein